MKKNKSKKIELVKENELKTEKSDGIQLGNDSVVFNFDMKGCDNIIQDSVYKKYGVSVDFKRTVRVPDDGKDYPLPAGLGNFQISPASGIIENHMLRDAEDIFMIPMHKEEALWINFNSF